MTADVKVKIIETAQTGWQEGLRALRSMPVVTSFAFFAALPTTVADLALMPRHRFTPDLDLTLLNSALMIGSSFLLTPLAIAVHRYVLLGEITRNYALNPFNLRFLRFFIFSVVIHTISRTIPLLVPALLGTALSSQLVISFLVLGLSSVGLFVLVRVVIMFPAIAIDAPSANWRNALHDTRGNSWRVFFVLIMTILPFVMLAILIYLLFLQPVAVMLASQSVKIILLSAGTVVLVAVYAATVSGLYRTLSIRRIQHQ